MKEWLVIVLPVGVLAGVPLYVTFRNRMVRRPKTENDFTAGRVFRLTITNLALNAVAATYFCVLFLAIGLKTDIYEWWLLTGLFAAVICLTFYGNGIYMTAIVIENYTTLELRKATEFAKQYVATHLFHGPISHIMIYSGWLVAFFLLGLLDMVKSDGKATIPLVVFLIGGGITGVVYALGQVYNGTTPYQFITGVGTLVLFVAAVWRNEWYVQSSSVASFFLGLNVLFDLTLVGYFIRLKRRGEIIDWDKSGYEIPPNRKPVR